VRRRPARYLKLADARRAAHAASQPTTTTTTSNAPTTERLREDLRLLYVALTRARHALWMGLAALRIGQGKVCLTHRSAVGHLLAGAPADARPLPPAALMALAQAAVQGCPHITLQPAAEAETLACTRLLARGQPVPLQDLVRYAAAFERRWTIGSFSGLVRDLATPAGLHANSLLSAAAAHHDDPVQAEGVPVLLQGPATVAVAPGGAGGAGGAQPWHGFPRGALAGNFVHDQLEWLAREGFALADAPELQAQLARRCDNQGWQARAQDLQVWLHRGRGHAAAAAVGHAAHAAPRAARDGVLAAHRRTGGGRSGCAVPAAHPAGLPRPALPERELRGMLMGFADLVFEHDGRYWVLDYKTNTWAQATAAYTPPR
jgi:exodeoxyribonuclease V beta subunit